MSEPDGCGWGHGISPGIDSSDHGWAFGRVSNLDYCDCITGCGYNWGDGSGAGNIWGDGSGAGILQELQYYDIIDLDTIEWCGRGIGAGEGNGNGKDCL
jgi:hypothetical protein